MSMYRLSVADRLNTSMGMKIQHKAQFGEEFIALVRGDVYFRALIGAVPVPTDAEIRRQARRAVRVLLGAYAIASSPTKKR
ncbi:MAG: TetR/AcrR family transcriptional regulator C-terminal domain-containing protein [Gammaproteobacteria bacterium]